MYMYKCFLSTYMTIMTINMSVHSACLFCCLRLGMRVSSHAPPPLSCLDALLLLAQMFSMSAKSPAVSAATAMLFLSGVLVKWLLGCRTLGILASWLEDVTFLSRCNIMYFNIYADGIKLRITVHVHLLGFLHAEGLKVTSRVSG